MKTISLFFFFFFLSENFQFLEVKFSIYLNRRVFVMCVRYDGMARRKLYAPKISFFFFFFFFFEFVTLIYFLCFTCASQ